MAVSSSGYILALDLGQKRIGVAIASPIARIASPYETLLNDQDFPDKLKAIIEKEGVSDIVVGLPRGMAGQETEQTRSVRLMAEDIALSTKLPVVFQDESLTSVAAEQEMGARGKIYAKADIDKLAATLILEDYLKQLG